MTVTVAWPVGKQRSDNHEPQFRPTGSDRLTRAERRIARIVYEAYRELDPAWNASLALGRIDDESYQRRVQSALGGLETALTAILFDTHQDEMMSMAGMIRSAVNQDLRRLRSPVRLRASETSKAEKAANVWLDWDGAERFTFDTAPQRSKSLVYAQFRGEQIVTYMGTEQVEMIRDQIARAFTEVQTFQATAQWEIDEAGARRLVHFAGRTVTGLTPQRAARELFTLLVETGVEGMELTAAQVAAYRSGYTNGLFPRWANAVNNYGDRMATQLD